MDKEMIKELERQAKQAKAQPQLKASVIPHQLIPSDLTYTPLSPWSGFSKFEQDFIEKIRRQQGPAQAEGLKKEFMLSRDSEEIQFVNYLAERESDRLSEKDSYYYLQRDYGDLKGRLMAHGAVGGAMGFAVVNLFMRRYKSSSRSLAVGLFEYGFISMLAGISFASRSYHIYQDELVSMGKRIRFKDSEAFVRFQDATEIEIQKKLEGLQLDRKQ
ncbi:hypothetical protein FGO68_gene7429 [Halteria grandinella]|uniref:Uncharacterized protein n=1 Tax=Halteria grandinella TaxID=5974 RepID=A0A8J8NJ03_HALGN|nr:hypothetical protein FGO68_gene7429 [Halteria grandinella]